MTTSDQHSTTTPAPTTDSAPAPSTGPKQRIADTIYYRSTQHQFDVDGQPFPWLITSDGATFTNHNGIHLAHITLIPIRKDSGQPVTIQIDPDQPPRLDGQPFPWLITDSGITIEYKHNFYPLITLDFLAHHIDTDTDVALVVDRRLPGGNQP